MTRWLALDRLRALAVVLMVQGHTFSALLQPEQLSQGVTRLHGLLHGLTAPAFLFGAGLAFGTATYGQYERHRTANSALYKRLRRYGWLILIGYALQLPGGSLWAAFHAQGAQLELVCRVGPLQLIALTLGLCQLAILVVPTPRRHALLAAFAGLLVMSCATSVASSGLAGRLVPLLGSFLDDSHGSQFPIFPWASFALFGVACSGLLHGRPQWLHALPFAVAGSGLAGVTYLAFEAGLIPYDKHWFWRTGPSYVLFRLGLVVLLLGLAHGRVQRNRSSLAPSLANGTARFDEGAVREDTPSAVLARHSLVAYVVHLLLLYGTPVTPNLARAFGGSLSLLAASSVCVSILGATVAAAYLWDWLVREQRLTVGLRRAAGLTLLSLVLLIR